MITTHARELTRPVMAKAAETVLAASHEMPVILVMTRVAHLRDLVEVPIQLLRPVEMVLVFTPSHQFLMLFATLLSQPSHPPVIGLRYSPHLKRCIVLPIIIRRFRAYIKLKWIPR